ncbi:hypothetical protein KG089_00415 [Carnobacteriaceae bacterium zg-ZUI252]|nr:hypothetical protein [Carnobacteriaceae bacterium zg-ZUI252]
MLEIGYSYHLKDTFFELVTDNYLMSNKENGGYRPHYYAIKDTENNDLYWMIPISSQYQKYKVIYDKKVDKYKKCDSISLGKFGGKNCAFLIQNAFPITIDYIDHVHTVESKPLEIHAELQKELSKKLKTALTLHKKGHRIFFVNIDMIKQKLIN